MAGFFDDLLPPAGSGGLDPRSRDLAIRTVYGEAGQEPEEGQAAVAHVIRNRVQAGRYGGQDVPSVVMARNQFEPWNGGAAKQRMLRLDPGSEEYQRLGSIVDSVWSGQASDPTSGATHFYSPSAQAVLKRPDGTPRTAPSWGREGGQEIGRHMFFAPDGRVGATETSFFDDLIPKEGTAKVAPVERRDLVSPQTDMGGYSPSQIPQSAPDIGRAMALQQGAYAGATANFNDEIEGLRAASRTVEPSSRVRDIVDRIPGASLVFAPYNAGQGLAALGIDYLRGGGEATKRYEDARDTARSDFAQAQAQYPGTTLAGQAAGAMALPAGRMLQAATLPARMIRGAAVGAGYGGLAGAGEGETTTERLSRGASGATMGLVAGAAAPPALAAVGGIGSGIGALARPITTAIRGMANPEGEAGRRVVSAITRDMQNGSGGIAPAEFTAQRAAGAPVANLDMGGEATRALARSSANTSPEGRQVLQNLADARFEGQSDRATQFLRGIVGPVDTQGTRDALRATAQNVNRPAYDRAYRAPGAQSMWDEGFEQLMQAPAVQEAARAATRTSANRAAAEGATPVRNPFQWDEQGRWTLSGDARPNLQFWDHVKRNLDDSITRLQRQGENSAARDAQTLRSQLLQRLDQTVPEFQAARQGAARFFGADDALSAGENFVRSNMSATQGQRALAQMSPAERDLFRQGFAARMIDEINGTRDRANVLNKIAQSQEARQKLQAALGPQGYQNLEAYLRVEQTMDRFRGALGNSTTARQLMEMGLAGGAGYGLSGGDLTTGGASALAALLVRRGGARIDAGVARRVAEMLTSNDPNVLAKGVRMVANNRALSDAFRALDSHLARTAGQQGTTAPVLQAAGIGRAQDDKPDVPRPTGQ